MSLRSALEFETDVSTGPNPLTIDLDANALAAACADSVIVFPAIRQDANGSPIPIGEFRLNGTVVLPAFARCRWRGPAANSVRITCSAPLAVRATATSTALAFERLVFSGCGVAIESSCREDVLFSECSFVQVKGDFSIRGAANGMFGPDRVTIRQCTFEECGLDKYSALVSMDPWDAIAKIAFQYGTGAVWMPSASRDWTLAHCGFVTSRGVPLRLHGSGCRLLDADFEARTSDLALGHEFVEVRSRESVIFSRLRFGNEGPVPYSLIRVIPPGVWSPVSGPTVAVQPTENIVLHATHAQGVPIEPPRSATTVVLDVQTPVRGLRVLDLTVGSSVDGAVRLTEPLFVRLTEPLLVSNQGTGVPTDVSPQNAVARINTALAKDHTAWFIGPDAPSALDLPPAPDTAPVLLGPTFDVAGDWPQVRLFRANDGTRGTRNWLHDTDVRLGPATLPPWWSPPGVSSGDGAPVAVGAGIGPWPVLPAVRLGFGQGAATVRFAQDCDPPSGASTAIVCLSVWSVLPMGMTMQLRLLSGPSVVASERFPGLGRAARCFVVATDLGTPGTTVTVELQVAADGGGEAWLMWPQLESGPRPTAYRRGPPGLSSPDWPAESWAVGPLGLRDGCPDSLDLSEHATGDRVVASVAGSETARQVFWIRAQNQSWRTALAADLPNAAASEWVVTGNVAKS